MTKDAAYWYWICKAVVAPDHDRKLRGELDDFQARHRRLREAMERLLGEFDGFDLKSHYGECSPPTTDCDGDCATDAWLQGLLSDVRATLAEDKEQGHE